MYRVCVVLLIACGSVSSNEKQDAAVRNDTSVTDAPADASVDAGPICLVDDFNGVSLSSSWAQTVGAAPTMTVGSGVATITDAAFAPSAAPDTPGESWINDFDVDKGNQMRWSAPVGTRDFVLTTALGWDTTMPELMSAGLGLVDSTNQIEVLLSARDSSIGGLGYAHAQIRVPNAGDASWAGTASTSGSTQLLVRRVNGLMIVEHGGNVVKTATNASSIAGLVLVTVRYRDDNNGNLNFGTATLDNVSLCY